MASKRILVIDGNTNETNLNQKSFGGQSTGEGYEQTLKRIASDTKCVIVRPAYDGYARGEVSLEGLDGAVITGSALHVMDNAPEVQNQIDLVRDVFEQEIPVFGSCWGIQLACVVLGGGVQASPNGMEVGMIKDICLTEEGRDHPLFTGKPDCIEAMAIHGDEVCALPEGARVLARNDHSPVQAVEVIQGGKVFWGVQYHPEFGPRDMAAIFKRYRARFVEQALFSSPQEINRWISVFETMERYDENGKAEETPSPELARFECRTREIANWLKWLPLEKS